MLYYYIEYSRIMRYYIRKDALPIITYVTPMHNTHGSIAKITCLTCAYYGYNHAYAFTFKDFKMTINTHEYKIGNTRNGSRVWLDACLKPFPSWANGNRYNRRIEGDTIVLTTFANGKNKVSGKADRPIIDLTGKWVTNTMGTATRCVVTISNEIITIEPKAE